MDKYILSKEEIDALPGTEKTHFLNTNAKRLNKSLGDLTGLNAIGFHIIEVEPGHESTEFHKHYYEEECVYILEGEAESTIGDSVSQLKAGDFVGYRAGGEAHKLTNTGKATFKCIVVGQRLDHDVGDYPVKGKRIYRNANQPWDLVDLNNIENPSGGKK